METQVLKFLEKTLAIPKGAKILLGISGGIDSMTMLRVMEKNKYKLFVAHCNFQLRGSDAVADEQFVQETCSKIGVPCFSKKFNTKTYAEANNLSIQMAARDLRYQWFDELCTLHGFDYIAIAHNADDAVETFFLNLTRGTGLLGLTGIQAKNGRIIRPLLQITRKQIEAFASENDVAFREDGTNAEVKYKRNHVRHNILPQFLKLNPSFPNTMQNNMQRLAEVEALVRNELEKATQYVDKSTKDNVRIPLQVIRNSLIPSHILLELLQPYGFSAPQINEVLSLLHSQPGKFIESAKYQIFRSRNDLLITPNHEFSSKPYEFKSLEELQQSAVFTYAACQSKKNTFVPEKRSEVAELDADKIKFPLILRHWKRGDYFIPFGMKGRKKLSDFFTDLKLDKPEKDAVWILESDGQIVWVVGYRIDERFKITDMTRTILKIVKRVN